jgi:hypothetical protein
VPLPFQDQPLAELFGDEPPMQLRVRPIAGAPLSGDETNVEAAVELAPLRPRLPISLARDTFVVAGMGVVAAADA